jgi:CHAT domain-containing protein
VLIFSPAVPPTAPLLPSLGVLASPGGVEVSVGDAVSLDGGGGAASGIAADLGEPPQAARKRETASANLIADDGSAAGGPVPVVLPIRMRHASLAVLVATLFLAGPAHAQKVQKAPPPAAQIEMAQLQKDLTDQQMKQANFAAVKTAKKLYEAQKKNLGVDAQETKRTEQTYAGLLSQTGAYTESYALYQDLVAQAEKEHGVDSKEVSWALASAQTPLWNTMNYDELEKLYQRSMALTKKLNGTQSREYAQALTVHSSVLTARNEFGAALSDLEEALKIEQAIAKDDIETIPALTVVASTMWQMGQEKKALVYYDQITKLAEKQSQKSAREGAMTLYSLAMQFSYAGREDLAKPMRDKTIGILEKEYARVKKATPDDYGLAGMAAQIAMTYQAGQDLTKAEKWLMEAKTYDAKRGTGYSGWDVVLANIKRQQGDSAAALQLYKDNQAQLAKIAPQATIGYNIMIVDALRDLGRYKEAEPYALEYLKYNEKQYGTHHPFAAMGQEYAAYVYMGLGDVKKAEAMLTSSAEQNEKQLALAMAVGTEADHALYYGRNKYHLDLAINFGRIYGAKSVGSTRLALTTLLRMKGRVLDASAANMATIRAKLSPEDKKLLDDLASARAQLSKLTVAGPTATGPDTYAKEIGALEDQVTKLEVAVGQKSAAYRANTQTVTLATVQKQIPKTTKLVEIVSYVPYDPKLTFKFNAKLPARNYGAFVLAASGDPTFIDLGPTADIDAVIEKFRKSLSNPADTTVTANGRALYDLTIAKLAKTLGTSTDILLAPDGALNVVPFSALVDADGKFLLEKYTFTYLTSGRDLLRLSVQTKAQGGGVIFADPAFDAGGKPAKGDGTRGRRSSDLSDLLWPALPGTAKEADGVEKEMKLTEFRQDKATEAALKAVHGPRVLHLATHGFFLPDEKETATGDTRAPAASANVALAQTAQVGPENPLLRSGLALAGANKLVSGNEDGILTAMEATGLDLAGTKLVVLSACETGVGKVTNGDGVYGLRRALVIAGAESLVMSLWQVDDEATKDLMVGYYKRLGQKHGRSTALRETQLELSAKPAYKHPFYWASFVPAGANAPLN